MATGRAPGKIIVVGEHFVVHGAPALAVPLLARHVEVEVHRDCAEPWQVAPEVEPHLRRMLEHLEEPCEALSVRVRSELPIGAGLGGSAALAVALVRALHPDVDDEQVRRAAHGLERLAHGRPSGVDDAVATYGRPVRYVRGQPPEVLTDAQQPALWVALTAERTSTMEAVAGVWRHAEAHPERFAVLVQRVGELATEASRALVAADWPALGRAMDDNQALLLEIGVSTPALDRLVDAARSAGALGAKLTGGGLGGAAIALTPNGQDLGPALLAAGATEVIAP